MDENELWVKTKFEEEKYNFYLEGKEWFHLIPREYKIHDTQIGGNMCEKAVDDCPGNILYVPHECQTYGMCVKAMDVDPKKYFRVVLNKHKTYDMCVKALEKWPYFIVKHIPEKFMTVELCRMMMNMKAGFAWKCFPVEVRKQVPRYNV